MRFTNGRTDKLPYLVYRLTESTSCCLGAAVPRRNFSFCMIEYKTLILSAHSYTCSATVGSDRWDNTTVLRVASPSLHSTTTLQAAHFSDINHLKPTGYVMHQQFNIQQLYVLPTLYLCVLYLSENKQRLVLLTA